jgi:colanic acid biosynthesis glycosyl transferase WcaI
LRILVLGINYAPEATGIGPFTTDLCQYLVAEGHAVTAVVAFPYYPEWKIHTAYRGRFTMREDIGGVTVRRCRLFIPARQSLVARLLHDLSFTIASFFSGLRSGPCDTVLVIAPPPTLALTGWILSRIRGARLVISIKDMALDLAEGLGFLSSERLLRVLRASERWLLDRADAVSVISEGFQDNLERAGLPRRKLHLLSDYVDTVWLRPTPSRFRARHAIRPEAFVVLYCGNLGGKQGLETLVEAARIVRASRILVLIVGAGPAEADLRRRAEGLEHVRFLPLQPREDLPAMLAAADLLFISQRAGVVASVLPGKLLHYMAAGRAVLAAVHPDSETARYVRRARCGLVVRPEDAPALAAAIEGASAGAVPLGDLGRAGRQFAERTFARQAVLPRYRSLLEGDERTKDFHLAAS